MAGRRPPAARAEPYRPATSAEHRTGEASLRDVPVLTVRTAALSPTRCACRFSCRMDLFEADAFQVLSERARAKPSISARVRFSVTATNRHSSGFATRLVLSDKTSGPTSKPADLTRARTACAP